MEPAVMLSVLKAARDVLVDPNRFCPKHTAERSDGTRANAYDHAAVRWDLYGAIAISCYEMPEIRDYASTTLGVAEWLSQRCGQRLWCVSEGGGHPASMRVLNEGIAALEAEERERTSQMKLAI